MPSKNVTTKLQCVWSLVSYDHKSALARLCLRWWINIVPHHCRWNNLGYLASLITFVGATVFWVATITGVPNELPDPSVAYVEWDILYWLPQVPHCYLQ